MSNPCKGCGAVESCAPLWPSQRKCCPDCTCVDEQGARSFGVPVAARVHLVDACALCMGTAIHVELEGAPTLFDWALCRCSALFRFTMATVHEKTGLRRQLLCVPIRQSIAELERANLLEPATVLLLTEAITHHVRHWRPTQRGQA